MSVLSSIKIVLVHTSHPGNIGAAARAMKTMGLSQLALVNPKHFPDEHATGMAAGAEDILENIVVHSSLQSALADCSVVFGTSARIRTLEWPLLNVREAAKNMIAGAASQPIAVVFGREHAGLTNDELRLCHYHVQIPSNPEFSSLNLAAAVQVVCYEILCAVLAGEPDKVLEEKFSELATQHDLELFYEHLEKTITALGFLDPKNPRLLMPRLRRLFSRTQLEKMEVDLLRGILTATDQALP